MLSISLKGVVCQALLKKKDGLGRVAALEIMVGTTGIANNIREGKTYQIPTLIQTGANLGMQTLNGHLLKLVEAGVVEPREAYHNSVDKIDISTKLRAAGFEVGA